MPYRQVYFDAPKDESIPVFPEMPDEYELELLGFRNYKEGRLKFEYWGKEKEFHCYHCHYCKGWIIGSPNEYEIDTLRPSQLAGRKGTEYYCKRCGKEIAFLGMMS